VAVFVGKRLQVDHPDSLGTLGASCQWE
jgi:hypothetical protein